MAWPGCSHFDQGQDQPAFSPDQLASGSLRGAAEDQTAAADQPGGGSNQPGTNQLRRTRGSGPTRANQAWRSGHQAPTSHGSATMVGRPPPAVQPVRIRLVRCPAFVPRPAESSREKTIEKARVRLTSAGLGSHARPAPPLSPARAPTRRRGHASWLRARAG